MREIKFRAWDKENKTMITTENVYLAMTFDGEISNIIDSNGECFWEGTYFSENKYDIMQYTGIKDKNGKEIYEGDILNVPSIENYELGVVKFGEHRDAFNGWYVQWKNKQGELNRSWTELGEIVGDIYKNPELLAI